MMPNFIDETGRSHGRLTVAYFAGYSRGKRKVVLWNCACSCGKRVTVRGVDLRSGHTSSCGCFRKECPSVKHGESYRRGRTKEYSCWQNIKDRCANPRATSFKYYGGRGIRVCGRWLNSFAKFLADVGRAPSPAHSIDRKDNDGNYEPDNVRWATKKEQANNRRTMPRR